MNGQKRMRPRVAVVAALVAALIVAVGFAFLGGLLPVPFSPGTSVTVFPSVETDPSHHPGDTADDIAIWIHPTDPSRSLIIGDDKEGGLMVWDLAGREVQYIGGTNYNNLDLRYGFPLPGQFATGDVHERVALVGVGDEGEQQIDFFKVDPATRRLESAGSLDAGTAPYGGCMYLSATGTYYFIAPDQEGLTRQWQLGAGVGDQVTGTLVREFDVGDITEGCVADDLLGHLYLAEEDVGIWKYGAEPEAGDTRSQVDRTAAGGHLRADVEGLSIYYGGSNAGYLIASSQGDGTVVVYTREGTNSFVGRFRVGASGPIDEVTGSDGLDVTNFPLGPGFESGLFAIHDTSNSGADASNVKFVPWASLAAAMGLAVDTEWDPREVGFGAATASNVPRSEPESAAGASPARREFEERHEGEPSLEQASTARS